MSPMSIRGVQSASIKVQMETITNTQTHSLMRRAYSVIAEDRKYQRGSVLGRSRCYEGC